MKLARRRAASNSTVAQESVRGACDSHVHDNCTRPNPLAANQSRFTHRRHQHFGACYLRGQVTSELVAQHDRRAAFQEQMN
jgi:hypothetical protein